MSDVQAHVFSCSARLEGQKAAKRGESPNPYPRGTIKGGEWDRGYYASLEYIAEDAERYGPWQDADGHKIDMEVYWEGYACGLRGEGENHYVQTPEIKRWEYGYRSARKLVAKTVYLRIPRSLATNRPIVPLQPDCIVQWQEKFLRATSPNERRRLLREVPNAKS
jgi:hypothetical protein